jgi:hypothetical protein
VFLVFCVVQDIVLNMASKGKKVDIKCRTCQSASDHTLCVRTHARPHSARSTHHGRKHPRTRAATTVAHTQHHGRVQHHGRTQQHPRSTVARSTPRSHTATAGPSGYLCSNAGALRSNAHLTQP